MKNGIRCPTGFSNRQQLDRYLANLGLATRRLELLPPPNSIRRAEETLLGCLSP